MFRTQTEAVNKGLTSAQDTLLWEHTLMSRGPVATGDGKKDQSNEVTMQNKSNTHANEAWSTNNKPLFDTWFWRRKKKHKNQSYRKGLQNQLWQRHSWVWGERGEGGFGDLVSSSQFTCLLCLWNSAGLMSSDSWNVTWTFHTVSLEILSRSVNSKICPPYLFLSLSKLLLPYSSTC